MSTRRSIPPGTSDGNSLRIRARNSSRCIFTGTRVGSQPSKWIPEPASGAARRAGPPPRRSVGRARRAGRLAERCRTGYGAPSASCRPARSASECRSSSPAWCRTWRIRWRSHRFTFSGCGVRPRPPWPIGGRMACTWQVMVPAAPSPLGRSRCWPTSALGSGRGTRRPRRRAASRAALPRCPRRRSVSDRARLQRCYGGISTTSTPPSVNTASHEAANCPARSRTRNRNRPTCSPEHRIPSRAERPLGPITPGRGR